MNVEQMQAIKATKLKVEELERSMQALMLKVESLESSLSVKPNKLDKLTHASKFKKGLMVSV